MHIARGGVSQFPVHKLTAFMRKREGEKNTTDETKAVKPYKFVMLRLCSPPLSRESCPQRRKVRHLGASHSLIGFVCPPKLTLM